MFLTPWLHLVKNTVALNGRRSLRPIVRRRPRRRANPHSSPMLQIENLEDRTLLSVASVFDAATGALAISSDAADAIAVTVQTTGYVEINGAPPSSGALKAADVQAISVTGDAGANNIDLRGVLTADFTSLASH